MWVQGIKVRILLLTLRIFIYSITNSLALINLYVRNFLIRSVNGFQIFYLTSYRNFFKESFLFDYLYKSALERFVLVWIFSGSLKLNFTYINAQLSKFVLNHVLEQTLMKTTRLNSGSFNALFVSFVQFFLFIVSTVGVIGIATILFT